MTVVTHTLFAQELLAAFPTGLKNFQTKYINVWDSIQQALKRSEVYISADSGSFARVQRPANLFRNSLVSASLVAGICNLMYVNA